MGQVAEELNTKETTIRGLIRSGKLSAIQVGGRGLVDRLRRTEAPTDGVRTYGGLPRSLAEGVVSYEQSPGAGEALLDVGEDAHHAGFCVVGVMAVG